MADLPVIMRFSASYNFEIHHIHMDFMRVRFHASTTLCTIYSHIAWAISRDGEHGIGRDWSVYKQGGYYTLPDILKVGQLKIV